jgi:hypothetical protein
MADTSGAEVVAELALAAAAAPTSGTSIAPLPLGDTGLEAAEDGIMGGDAADDEADDDNPGEDISSDFFDGRPDLSQNAIENLRLEHRRLREQQKKVRKDMKNQKRMRSRIIKRVKHLDTASVLQVLIERGVSFGSLKGAAGVAAAASAVASAHASRAASTAASSAGSH